MQVSGVMVGLPTPIPILAKPVRAGFPSPADDFVEEEIDLQRLLIANRPATFLVRVAGDSMMLARLFDGDLGVVDREAGCLGDADPGVAVTRVQPFAAEVERVSPEILGERASPEARRGLKQQRRLPLIREPPRRADAGGACPHDDDVVLVVHAPKVRSSIARDKRQGLQGPASFQAFRRWAGHPSSGRSWLQPALQAPRTVTARSPGRISDGVRGPCSTGSSAISCMTPSQNSSTRNWSNWFSTCARRI